MPQGIVFEVCTGLGIYPGVQRAMEAMHAFKLAGNLGLWWKATNDILRGCVMLVILINALMGIWKTKIDNLHEHTVVTTGDLPPLRMHDANHQDNIAPVFQGPGTEEVAAGGYADDTDAVAPSLDALQRLAPATELWLRLTGQEVNVGKSITWTLAGDQAPMRLLGAPIPIEGEFRHLGIRTRVSPERGTGPLLRQWMERGGSVLPCQLTTYHWTSKVVGALAMAVAVHGVSCPTSPTLTWQDWRPEMSGPFRAPRGLVGPRRWSTSCHPVIGHQLSCGRSTTS